MGKLFQELKRRNVYKVATLYVVASWVLLQVTETVFPIFDISTDLLRPITLVLLVGFLPVLVLTWIYEYSAEGFRKTQTDKAEAAPVTFGTDIIVIFLLLVVVGFTAAERFLDIADTTGSDSSVAAEVIRSSINLGEYERNPYGLRADFALSPDGSRLAYAKFSEGQWDFYERELDELEPRLVGASNTIETINNTYPGFSFSPDGESLVFNDGGSLSTLSLVEGGGGVVATGVAGLNTESGPTGTSWAEDQILFRSQDGSTHRLTAGGNVSEELNVTLGEGERGIAWSHFLPGAEYALVTTIDSGRLAETANIDLLNLDSGAKRTLIRSAYNARYAQSGHIVFVRNRSLWAVAFDLASLQIIGNEVQVVEGIDGFHAAGLANYSFSDRGRLAYLPLAESAPDSLVSALSNILSVPTWIDRDGRETALEMEPRVYITPSLAPDDESFTATVSSLVDGAFDIWKFEIERQIYSRVTFGGTSTRSKWSHDGERLAIQSNGGIWLYNSDGSGEAEKLLQSQATGNTVLSFTPDDDYLVYGDRASGATSDGLYLLSLEGERNSMPLLVNEFSNAKGQVSPDGNWIAYVSNETGRSEIYVRPFPNVTDGKSAISSNGGDEPKWRGDSQELFFKSIEEGQQSIWSVPVGAGPEFVPGTPQRLFTKEFVQIPGPAPNYDVSSDGQRFLGLLRTSVPEVDTTADTMSLVLVENWFEELKRLAPPNPQ